MKQSHECINDFTKMQSKWLGDKADTQKIGCPRLLSIWCPYQVLLLVSRWKYVWLSQKKGYILVDLILSTTPSNTSNFLTQVSYGSLLVRASKHLQNCQLHILFHVQSLWLQWSPEQQMTSSTLMHNSTSAELICSCCHFLTCSCPLTSGMVTHNSTFNESICQLP